MLLLIESILFMLLFSHGKINRLIVWAIDFSYYYWDLELDSIFSMKPFKFKWKNRLSIIIQQVIYFLASQTLFVPASSTSETFIVINRQQIVLYLNFTNINKHISQLSYESNSALFGNKLQVFRWIKYKRLVLKMFHLFKSCVFAGEQVQSLES